MEISCCALGFSVSLQTGLPIDAIYPVRRHNSSQVYGGVRDCCSAREIINVPIQRVWAYSVGL